MGIAFFFTFVSVSIASVMAAIASEEGHDGYVERYNTKAMSNNKREKHLFSYRAPGNSAIIDIRFRDSCDFENRKGFLAVTFFSITGG